MLYGMKPRASKDKRNPIATAIGKRVKVCRVEAELTQEQLAHEALVDRSYVSSIERGVANPSIETLANLCYCMGITLSRLFEPLTIALKPTGERRSNIHVPVSERKTRR
ncbi:helix-turn-helix transcriptional regulator [Ralstonia solanacearum]|uniref:helix-turn-helix transcriptional regulator n=1 Tax=Ralstonia solanacearum TaxID=305 RepID=UPI000E56D895|nr:helix-turn-helix transcriptional regulator [Ralstonia solanacearum]AXW25271.1 transcriptional regulator [Ralstonia solanacearum]